MTYTTGLPQWLLNVTGPNVRSGSVDVGRMPNLSFDPNSFVVISDPLNDQNVVTISGLIISGTISGSLIPNATEAGDYLTSTGTSPGQWTWLPPGGFAISTFTGFTQTVEVGTTVSTPTVNMTYNTAPDSATVSWTNPSTGSPHVLTTPFTSYTIAVNFTSSIIGATSTATLSATKGTSTKTSTQTITFAGAICFGSVASGTEAAGQSLYNTLRASGFSLHTSNGGSYPYASATGFDQVIAIPNAFGTPTVKDGNGFVYTPVLIGNASVTENGTTQSVNFFTLGNPGSTVTFTLS